MTTKPLNGIYMNMRVYTGAYMYAGGYVCVLFIMIYVHVHRFADGGTDVRQLLVFLSSCYCHGVMDLNAPH